MNKDKVNRAQKIRVYLFNFSFLFFFFLSAATQQPQQQQQQQTAPSSQATGDEERPQSGYRGGRGAGGSSKWRNEKKRKR
jgi:hypothetical protein